MAPLPEHAKAVESVLMIKFDGPELKSHQMDVTLLAPSLLAFGELCKQANFVLNGEKAQVTVLLSADVDASCVTLQLSVVQMAWDAAAALLPQLNVENAKHILEFLGFIKTIGGGLIPYLWWKGNRKEESAETKTSVNGPTVNVRVKGDNNTTIINMNIPEPVYKLSKDPKVIESVKTMTNPVSESYGITEQSFIYENKRQLTIDAASARALRVSTTDTDTVEPQIVTAHIVVHNCTLATKPKKWKFKFNNRVEIIDIGESTIAADVMARGGVSVGDTYKVRLEMIERKNSKGEYVTHYKVKEVLEFIPGHRAEQSQLFPPTEDL
jgi:hypothetical protein